MKSKTFRRILVVEDDLSLLEELKLLFEAEFEEVVLACDGAEAYVHSTIQDFDLIFTDHRMPGMTGLELVKRLRSEGKNAPVILASASAEAEHMVQAIRLGVLDFVEKPYTPQTLKETLYRNLEILLREKKLMSHIQETGPDSPAANQQKRMIGLLQAVHSAFKKAL